MITSLSRNADSVEFNVHLRPLEVGMKRREGSTAERKKIMTPNEEVLEDPNFGNLTTACLRRIYI
jgi:hypothetical protein